MEVVEIINYYINKDNNVIEVEFRFMTDSEEIVREDVIEYSYLGEFGYSTETLHEEGGNWDDGWDDDFTDENEEFIDEDDLVSFLNEYYVVHSDKIPQADLN
jgi:hypothetical protein